MQLQRNRSIKEQVLSLLVQCSDTYLIAKIAENYFSKCRMENVEGIFPVLEVGFGFPTADLGSIWSSQKATCSTDKKMRTLCIDPPIHYQNLLLLLFSCVLFNKASGLDKAASIYSLAFILASQQ